MESNPVTLAGFRKKSFQMSFRDGMIWFEHLDGLQEQGNLVLEKLKCDSTTFSRPSISSLLCFVFDETVVTDAIIAEVADKLTNTKKIYTRICFVGINKHAAKAFRIILSSTAIQTEFIDDLEKAKEWLVPTFSRTSGC